MQSGPKTIQKVCENIWVRNELSEKWVCCNCFDNQCCPGCMAHIFVFLRAAFAAKQPSRCIHGRTAEWCARSDTYKMHKCDVRPCHIWGGGGKGETKSEVTNATFYVQKNRTAVQLPFAPPAVLMKRPNTSVLSYRLFGHCFRNFKVNQMVFPSTYLNPEF